MIGVDGKPSTINSKRRRDQSHTRKEEEVKPVTEGTGIPYEARSNQPTINTHTTTVKSYPYHEHENINLGVLVHKRKHPTSITVNLFILLDHVSDKIVLYLYQIILIVNI